MTSFNPHRIGYGLEGGTKSQYQKLLSFNPHRIGYGLEADRPYHRACGGPETVSIRIVLDMGWKILKGTLATTGTKVSIRIVLDMGWKSTNIHKCRTTKVL